MVKLCSETDALESTLGWKLPKVAHASPLRGRPVGGVLAFGMVEGTFFIIFSHDEVVPSRRGSLMGLVG